MKRFIITVDTEGDNLWKWREGNPITTENVKFIPRFQELCEKYALIPTYLTNYEMAMNDEWVKYCGNKSRTAKCEIGMHLHAWNSPPYYRLNQRYGGNSYITEYPLDVMQEKINKLVLILQERFEVPITSNRSGRWSTNKDYFKILQEEGIMVDCSITPDIDMSNITGSTVVGGNNYKGFPKTVFYPCPGLLEVPMTTRKLRYIASGTLKHKMRALILGEGLWLRPFTKSYKDMVMLSETVKKEGSDYLEFMIHSSELMPGGSPYFKNTEEVELLYKIMDKYFSYITDAGYAGISLSDYAKEKSENSFNIMIFQ